MNEIIFFTHIFFIIAFLFGALKIGKEALSAYVILQAIIANLFVVKQITLFQKEVTCSDVYMVGSILGMNLLQEYFGKDTAKKTMWITFYCMIFFSLTSYIHLGYIPSKHDTTHQAFFSILSQAPRIFLASVATFFLVQKFDILFFGILKKMAQDRYLTLRIVVSLVLSQLLDTALFSFLGLYGIASSMFDIIVLSFSIKLIVIFTLAPFVKLSKRFVRA